MVYAGIDTDKHRYPIGSGRVAFGNPHSYMKAVAAAFVEIKCRKFCKKVQVSRPVPKVIGRTFHQGGSLPGGCALLIVSPPTRTLLLQVFCCIFSLVFMLHLDVAAESSCASTTTAVDAGNLVTRVCAITNP